MRQGIWKKDFEAYQSRTEARKTAKRLMANMPYNGEAAIVTVADPIDGSCQPALRSTRETLFWMHSHGQIEEWEFQAGKELEELFRQSTIGPIKAIDPTKESVDSSKVVDCLSDTQIEAFRKVRECHRELGAIIFDLLFDILGRGQTIKQTAEQRGYKTDYGARIVSSCFKDGLRRLSIFWGLAG